MPPRKRNVSRRFTVEIGNPETSYKQVIKDLQPHMGSYAELTPLGTSLAIELGGPGATNTMAKNVAKSLRAPDGFKVSAASGTTIHLDPA